MNLNSTPQPPGTNGQSSPSTDQEEALFHALLERVQGAHDKAHLEERSEAALRLILHRPADHERLLQMIRQIHHILADLPAEGALPSQIGHAATACVRVLQAARRPQPGPHLHHVSAPVETATGSALRAKPSHEHVEPEVKPTWPFWAAAAVGLGAIVVWVAVSASDRRHGGQAAVRPLVSQMEAAAHGTVPSTNLFGGSLRVVAQSGSSVVTVDGIPAGECVSAGWDLVRKGVLSINGVTPVRVSAAKLNELCHDGDTATLVWAPKN